MSRANNSMWKSLTNNLTQVLNESLEEDAVNTVLTNWENKKRDVTRLLDKTPKKKADPNAPKKPRSSYILFSIESRPKITAQFPNISNRDIPKKLGEAWNNLSLNDKKKYEDLASKDKERFESEQQSYVPSVESSSEEVGRKKQKSNGPKRPLTAYMYFCVEERSRVNEQHPEMPGKKITSELANRWKILTDEQKVVYETKQKADKVRYENEKEALGIVTKNKGKKSESKAESKKADAKKVESKPVDAKKAESKPVENKKAESKKAESKKETKKETKRETKKAEPKKAVEIKPPTKAASKTVKKTPGFEYFVNEQSEEVLSENPNYTNKKVMEVLSERWNSLSQNERTAYENEADVGSEVELEDD